MPNTNWGLLYANCLQEDTRGAMEYEQEEWRICAESISLPFSAWRDTYDFMQVRGA